MLVFTEGTNEHGVGSTHHLHHAGEQGRDEPPTNMGGGGTDPRELHQSQNEAPRWAFPRGGTEVPAPDRILFEGLLGRPGFRVQSGSGLRSEIPINSSVHSPNEQCGCSGHRGSERIATATSSPHPYWAPRREEEARNEQTCPSHPGEEKECAGENRWESREGLF